MRKALERSTIQQIESARNTALARGREADDPAMADVYGRIADEMTNELDARLVSIVTRDVLKASQEATRDAKALLAQMTS